MRVTYRWINVHGEGHYEVTNGVNTVTCDCGELNETIAELEQAK